VSLVILKEMVVFSIPRFPDIVNFLSFLGLDIYNSSVKTNTWQYVKQNKYEFNIPVSSFGQV